MQKIWVRVLTTLMTLCVMGGIYYFSTESATDSDATSGIISTWLADRIRPEWREMAEPDRTVFYNEVQHVVRKTAHFCEFALLGFCLRGCLESWMGRRKSLPLWSWGGGTFYAALDELHQMQADGRAAQGTDALLDSAGVLCGVLLAAGLLMLVRKRMKKNRESDV